MGSGSLGVSALYVLDVWMLKGLPGFLVCNLVGLSYI